MTTPNKEERIFERPVAWLLGKQLLGGLKGILLYTAYGAKLDPRDWMTAKEVSFESAISRAKKSFGLTIYRTQAMERGRCTALPIWR